MAKTTETFHCPACHGSGIPKNQTHPVKRWSVKHNQQVVDRYHTGCGGRVLDADDLAILAANAV